MLGRFLRIFQSGLQVEKQSENIFSAPFPKPWQIYRCSQLFSFSNLLLNFLFLTFTKPTLGHKWLTHRRQKETKNDTASFQYSVWGLNVPFYNWKHLLSSVFQTRWIKHEFFLIQYLPSPRDWTTLRFQKFYKDSAGSPHISKALGFFDKVSALMCMLFDNILFPQYIAIIYNI